MSDLPVSNTLDKARAFLSPRKAPLWILVAVVFYNVLGFWIVPWVAKDQLPKQVQSQLGLDARVDVIEFNPWVLSLRVTGLAIQDPDGKPLAGFDELFVNLQTSSLFNWAITLAEARLDKPYGSFIRYSFTDTNVERALNAAPPAEAPEEIPADDSGLLRILIYKLAINDGILDFEDRLPATPFKTAFGPVDIAVNDFSTLPDTAGNQTVSIKTENGATIEWSGSLETAPLNSAGQLSIDGELLPLAYRYIQDDVTFALDSGSVALSLDYTVQATTDGGIEAIADSIAFQVANVLMTDKAGGGQILSLPMLRVENGTVRWPQQSAAIDLIAVDDFRIDAWLDENGALNLDNLLIESGPAETPDTIDTEELVEAAEEVAEASAEESEEWALRLTEFQINNFSAGFRDDSLNKPAELGIVSLNASIRDISNAPDAAFPFNSQLNLLGGGTITESGSITVLPEILLDSELKISGLQLSMVQPYISEFARARIDSGEINMDAKVTSTPEEQLTVRGSVSIDKLATQDMVQNVSLLDWQKLLIDDLLFKVDANSLEISKVLLDRPFVRFEIAADQSTNFGDLVIEQPATAEPAAEDAEEMRIQIGETDIRQGKANFKDLSLPLPFAAEIAKLDGDLSTISTVSSAPTRVDVKGQVDEFGTASISGNVRVFDPLNLMDIQVEFANLNMPTLSPYTVEFVGQKVESGKLDVNLGYKFDKGQMEGSNAIVIDQFTLGEKVPSDNAMNLPLGLAVALLKDKDGVIDIDLQVSGNVDDPEFSVAGLILKALGNLVTKVATSPFRALGGLVGGDDIDLDILQFEPGSDALTPPDREKLLKLSAALEQRPELQLLIPPTLHTDSDRLAMQQAAVEQLVDMQMSDKDKREDEPDMFIKRQRKVLEKIYKEQIPDGDYKAMRDTYKRPPPDGGRARLDEVAYSDELRRQLVAKQPIPDEMLNTLALARAENVSSELNNSVPTLQNRIQITEPQAGETENDSGDDTKWIIMKLEIDASALETAVPETATPEDLASEESGAG